METYLEGVKWPSTERWTYLRTASIELRKKKGAKPLLPNTDSSAGNFNSKTFAAEPWAQDFGHKALKTWPTENYMRKTLTTEVTVRLLL